MSTASAPTTARLPQGWECRLVAVCNPNTNGATGWCLEVHDIAVAKSVAGREKDLRYIRDLWKEGLISLDTMQARLDATDIDADARQRLKALAHAHAAAHRKPSQLPPGRSGRTRLNPGGDTEDGHRECQSHTTR